MIWIPAFRSLKKNFRIFLIISLFFINTTVIFGHLYDISFDITGNAKGRILIIFPYRVYYNASASLIFSTSDKDSGETVFKLKKINKTGYMMRTLGFSGRSLAVLTADNDKKRGEKLYANLRKKFSKKASEYSENIKKYYWNNFIFKKTVNAISFLRKKNGTHNQIKYNLWLKRSPDEKPIKINFNIYRILGEIIKAYNHSYLPSNTDLSMLESKPNRKWTSEKIDFSDILDKATHYSAGIFSRIKPLKQDRPFRVNYSSSLSGRHILLIKGIAEPKVSVWGSFKIKKFVREVKIRLTDRVLISDMMIIDIYNDSGKGGKFVAKMLLKDQLK